MSSGRTVHSNVTIQMALRYRAYLEKKLGNHLFKKFPALMEPTGSHLFSKMLII
jgi:hypothetical protein